MVVKANKSRKKKAAQVEVRHAVYGLGRVVERRPTDVLVVRFPDKTIRTLLADANFWNTPEAQLKAIPVAPPRKFKPEAKDEEVEAVAVAAA